MALIQINPLSQLCMDIDLKDTEWISLLPESIGNFKIEENLRQCASFPDGLFPGAKPLGETGQISRVRKFLNYIEFSKVTSDEVVPLTGQLYLTTKFFERRKKGWSSETIEKKEGEILGYCIDGDLYSPEDKVLIDKVFFGTVYRSLVQDLPIYLKLVNHVKSGVCLRIKGDPEFLRHLETLLNSKS